MRWNFPTKEQRRQWHRPGRIVKLCPVATKVKKTHQVHHVSMYKATGPAPVGAPTVELHRVPALQRFKNHRHQRFQDQAETRARWPLLWILAQAFPYSGFRSFKETQ
ncbi:hypothetical protein V6N11_022532 [Hibiscus sabdariffa]|uniref:Uncharacterized protein n=1 Tax=Hibiscus sabdariffa TaxID=183260 RepID=A0ABR2TKC7_9ROSI